MTTISKTDDAHLVIPIGVHLLAKLSANAMAADQDILTYSHHVLQSAVSNASRKEEGRDSK